jgi:hypothetical protein
MEQVNINVTKVEKEVTINATPNVTQIIVTTQSGGGGGIPDAPNNSNAYVRSALSWVVGYTKTAIDNLLNLKQNLLVSGTNIKTINSESILGSGNIDIIGGSTNADDITETATRVFVTPAQESLINTAIQPSDLGAVATSNDYNDLDNLPTIPSISGLATESYANAKVEDTIVNDVTDKAPSQNAVFDALSLKADKSTTPIILKNNFTPNTLTAPVATEAIVDNYDLGVGFLAVGESLNFEAVITKNTSVNGTIQSFLYLSKVSNSISVTDAVKIATSSSLGAGGGSVNFERIFHRRTSSILSCRIAGTTAASTDFASLNNLAQNIINDVNLNDYRFLIVASTYTGTTGPNTMQTNIILTKNPVV